MNTIDTSQISDPNVQQPFLGGSLSFLQNATKEVVAALAQCFAGDSYSTTIGYSVYGCKRVSMISPVVAAGFMYFNGEIYYFPGISNYTSFVHTGVYTAVQTHDGIDPVLFSDGSTKSVHNINRITLSDQADGTGLFNFSSIVYIQDKVNNEIPIINTNITNIQTSLAGLSKKIISIGDWDMTFFQSISIAHGLTADNIRSIQVIVRADDLSAYSDLNQPHQASTSDFSEHDGYYYYDGTNVILNVRTGGSFDSSLYNATSFNRGWIVIEHL